MSRNGFIELPPTRVDTAIADASAGIARPSFERTIKALTLLADERPLIAAAAAAWLCIRLSRKDERFRRDADQMLCSVAIASVVPHLFKLLVDRERPDRTRVRGRRNGIPKSGHAWDSFPSGHAVHVGAIAHCAARMAPDRLRPLIWLTALALASTRVLLLAHYASDVISELAIGIWIDRLVAALFKGAAVPPTAARRPASTSARASARRPQEMPSKRSRPLTESAVRAPP